MSDRQRRISGLGFVAGVLVGLVLIGVGGGLRTAKEARPSEFAASRANRSP